MFFKKTQIPVGAWINIYNIQVDFSIIRKRSYHMYTTKREAFRDAASKIW